MFESGEMYLTSFLIYCRKNYALSVSINNQPRINVRKIDAAQTAHNSILSEKVKIILSGFNTLKNYQIHHE